MTNDSGKQQPQLSRTQSLYVNHSKEVKSALDQREVALKRWESLSKVVFRPQPDHKAPRGGALNETSKSKRASKKNTPASMIARRDPCALVNKVHDSFALIANEEVPREAEVFNKQRFATGRDIRIPIADTFLLRSGQFLWWLKTSTEGQITAKQLSRFQPQMLLDHFASGTPAQYRSPTRFRRSSPRSSLNVSVLSNNKLISVVRSRHKNKLKVSFHSYHSLVELFSDRTAFSRVISIQRYVPPLQTATSTGVYQNTFVRDSQTYHINFITTQIHSSRSDAHCDETSEGDTESPTGEVVFRFGDVGCKQPVIDTSFQPDKQDYIKSAESSTNSATAQVKKHLSAYTSRIIRYIEKRWSVEVSNISVEYIMDRVTSQPVFTHISTVQVSKPSSGEKDTNEFKQQNPGVHIKGKQESFMGAKLGKVKLLHMMLGNRAKDGHLINTKRKQSKRPEPLANLPEKGTREKHRKPAFRATIAANPSTCSSSSRKKTDAMTRPTSAIPLTRSKTHATLESKTRPQSAQRLKSNKNHKQSGTRMFASSRNITTQQVSSSHSRGKKVTTQNLSEVQKSSEFPAYQQSAFEIPSQKSRKLGAAVQEVTGLEDLPHTFHRVRTLLCGPTRDALSRVRCWGQFCDSMGQQHFDPSPRAKVVLRSILFAGIEGISMQCSESEWKPQQYFDAEDSDDEAKSSAALKIRVKLSSSPEIVKLATISELTRTFRVKMTRCYEAVDVCCVCAEAYQFLDHLRAQGKLAGLCGVAGVSSVQLSQASKTSPSFGMVSTEIKTEKQQDTSKRDSTINTGGASFLDPTEQQNAISTMIIRRQSSLLNPPSPSKRKSTSPTRRMTFNPRHSMAQLIQDTGVSPAEFQQAEETKITRPIVPTALKNQLNQTLLNSSSKQRPSRAMMVRSTSHSVVETSADDLSAEKQRSLRRSISFKVGHHYGSATKPWETPKPPKDQPIPKPLKEIIAGFVQRNGLPPHSSSDDEHETSLSSKPAVERKRYRGSIDNDEWSGSQSSDTEHKVCTDNHLIHHESDASESSISDQDEDRHEYVTSVRAYSAMSFRCKRIASRLSKHPLLANVAPPIIALRRWEYLVPQQH